MDRDIPQAEWLQKREAVLERDGRECQDCGKSEEEAESLHVHHITPVKEGGRHELSNLQTLCQFCHVQLHADERRKGGTLKEVEDHFHRAEVPALKHTDLARRLDCSVGQARKRLDALVEKGFLEKPARGTYIKSDYPADHANGADSKRIIIGGSVVIDGEYIGREDQVLQCDGCKKYFLRKNPNKGLKSHEERCSEFRC